MRDRAGGRVMGRQPRPRRSRVPLANTSVTARRFCDRQSVSAQVATRTERPAPSAVASRAMAQTAETPAAVQPKQLAQVTYKVKKGDTLFSIAQLFDTTVAKIKSWNRLSSNQIAPGARLRILASRGR